MSSSRRFFPLLLFHPAGSFYHLWISSICLNSLIYVPSVRVICLGLSLVSLRGVILHSDRAATVFPLPIASPSPGGGWGEGGLWPPLLPWQLALWGLGECVLPSPQPRAEPRGGRGSFCSSSQQGGGRATVHSFCARPLWGTDSEASSRHPPPGESCEHRSAGWGRGRSGGLRFKGWLCFSRLLSLGVAAFSPALTGYSPAQPARATEGIYVRQSAGTFSK